MADSNENNESIKVNSNDSSFFPDEILKLAQCLMPEPPTAKLKRVIANGEIHRQPHEVEWNAYETVVAAINDATNRFYTNPAVGNALGRAIDIALRWQRWNTAVAGAFFAALWPAVGLPLAADVEAIRSDVRSMREELRDAVAERDAERSPVIAPALVPAAVVPIAALPAVWSGWPGKDAMERGKDVGH